MTLDANLTQDEHFTSLTAKAKKRRALLRRIGHLSWGAAVGILKTTTDAIAGSSLRYGNVIMGSRMPSDLMER